MINIPGLITIIIFYLVILAVGIWAAWTRRKQTPNMEEMMVANRSIGYFVGFLTLTATWVGGGYINGSAEAIYDRGLIWCQAPFGYSLSLLLGGLFFAKQMREAGYVTMLDPLQEIYGIRWGAFLFFPALAGELLWSAAILAALGSTLAVILNLDISISIITSAGIAVTYTLFGGLSAVAYTDVVQLFCIFIGLWLAIPFALKNENVGSLALSETDWLGSLPSNGYEWGAWVDYYILLMFGGIPWQVYFQRILAARSSKQAQILSFAASIGCFVMVIPACIIGAIAKSADWESTSYGKALTDDDKALVLPLVIQYLTPTWVSLVGLGAVSAAVMSSADSSVLSSASMFSRNIYVNVFRPKASYREVIWVMRMAVIVAASIACYIAINTKSVYDLLSLCGDLVFVMLFPQLTLAVHAPNHVNQYGSMAAYFLGFLIRILGGEDVLNVPAVIKFPFYDYEKKKQMFPFRTLSMVVTFITLLVVSRLTKNVFIRTSSRHQSSNADQIRNKRAENKGVDNLAMDKSGDNLSMDKSGDNLPMDKYDDNLPMYQSGDYNLPMASGDISKSSHAKQKSEQSTF